MKNRRPVASHRQTLLRKWRRYRGYTLQQLAERAGTTHGTLSRLENGRLPYTQSLLEDIANALATDCASLIARDPEDPEGVWAIAEKLNKLPSLSRRQALRLLEAFAEVEEEDVS